MGGCCNTCELVTTKIILVFLNSVFLLCGMSMLGCGIWFLVDPYILSYLNIADLGGDGNLATITAYVILGIGAFMFIISFFGCFGACCGNHCMLNTYCVLMVIAICGQIALGVIALVNKSWVSNTLEDGMVTFVQQEYLGASSTEISKSWDNMQIQFGCCGAAGRDDYNGSRWESEVATAGWNWPETCCFLNNSDPENPEPENEAGCRAGLDTAMHTQGCYTPMGEWLEIWGAAVAGSFIAFAILQMGMVGLACCMISALKTYPVDSYVA